MPHAPALLLKQPDISRLFAAQAVRLLMGHPHESHPSAH